jgi:hypothetical protein
MDLVTETLLRELEASQTDLRKLVLTVLCRNRPAIGIASEAIARWERDDPHGWASVREWLLSRGIKIILVSATADPR